jgi:hypothetical protein
MKISSAAIALTIATLLASVAHGGVGTAQAQNFQSDTKIHLDAKKSQTPEFLEKLRKSKLYEIVGRGKVNFSEQTLRVYEKMKNHGNGVLVYGTPDGQQARYSWCRGSYCDTHFYNADAVIAGVRSRCSEIFGRGDCVIIALEENFDLSGLSDFQGKVLWDFGTKSEAQKAAEARARKGAEYAKLAKKRLALKRRNAELAAKKARELAAKKARELAAKKARELAAKKARELAAKRVDVSTRENAELFLRNIRDFYKNNPKAFDPLVLGKRFGPAQQEVAKGTFKASSSNLVRLSKYAGKNEDFARYHKTILAGKKKARDLLKQKIASDTKAGVALLKARLSADPLAPDAFKLTQVIATFDGPTKGRALNELRLRFSKLRKAAQKFNINITSSLPPRNADVIASRAFSADRIQSNLIEKKLQALRQAHNEETRRLKKDLAKRSASDREKIKARLKDLQKKSALKQAAMSAQLKALNDRSSSKQAGLEAQIESLRDGQRDHLKEAFSKRSPDLREAVQQRLFELGFYKSTIDGAFGTGTRLSITEYARRSNTFNLQTTEGAEEIIKELVGLDPKSTGVVTSAPKGYVPLDLKKQDNAKLYLRDIREFVALNPKALDSLVLARTFSRATRETENGSFNKAGSSFLKLSAYTRGSAPFREFHRAQNSKRYEANAGKRKAVAQVIAGYLKTIKARVAVDPLAADTYELTKLIDRYQEIPKGANAAALNKLRADFAKDLEKLGVAVGKVRGGDGRARRSSTADLKALSDIGPKDVVMLVNLGKGAPHAYRDLSGKIAFENKKINACVPGLGAMEPQYRIFVSTMIDEALAEHTFEESENCERGLKGLDALLVTGTDLAKSQDIPTADQLVLGLKQKSLTRLMTVKYSDFSRELAKREILSAQYKNDIEEGARVGFGAIAFEGDAEVACTSIDSDVTAHDQSIQRALSALRFSSGVVVKQTTNVSATVAFRQAQKGRCTLVYTSAKTLKEIIGASTAAGLKPTILPVWTTQASITKRSEQLASGQANSLQSKARRQALLEQRAAELEAKRKALAAQLEERQRRYRAQNRSKVVSLVGSIDAQLKAVRAKIDETLISRKGVRTAVEAAKFWGQYPRWYADKRMKGWDFDSTVPTPKDYGIAKWNGRAVEAITAQIRVVMKNRNLGKYSDDCWNFGYLLDTEFSMNREPFVARCSDAAALKTWQTKRSFESRWDLGVR